MPLTYLKGCAKARPAGTRGPVPASQHKNLMNRRMMMEYGSVRRLDQNVQLQVGAPIVQRFQQREGQNRIAKGSQANQQNFRDMLQRFA